MSKSIITPLSYASSPHKNNRFKIATAMNHLSNCNTDIAELKNCFVFVSVVHSGNSPPCKPPPREAATEAVDCSTLLVYKGQPQKL